MAAKSSLWSRIKRVFIKGLATLLPTILTIYLFFWIFGFIRTNVSEPINSFFGKQLYSAEWGRSYLYDKFEIPFQDEAGKPLEGDALAKELTDKLPWWPGFVIAFVAVLGVGFFIASWLGRGLFKTGEGLIGRIPVVKVIYPYAKQVTDFVFGDKKTPVYSRVVAVQYMRTGIWGIGFVTGEGLQDVRRKMGKSMLTVFMPCSPAPMSGFALVVPADEVVPLDMTVDEAMRFIISAGVIVPQQQLTEEGHTRILELKESGRLPPITRSDIRPPK